MIPLSVPNISGNEWKYVKECLDTGWVSTSGNFVQKFEKEFSNYIGSHNAVSFINGTSALHIALQTLGVKSNEFVIMPNITFVATANAISYIGAEPLLIDVDEYTWQMDLEILENFLSNDCKIDKNNNLIEIKSAKKISAIVIVHVQGNICDFDKLKDIAKNFKLPIIEDAAEALGSCYNGIKAGTLGDIGCFSFNGNKIMTTGGGGMLVSKNKEYLNYARHIASTAKTNPLRYEHDQVGYNYRLTNILSAIGLAQLENIEKFITRKREVAETYRNELSGIGDIKFQKIIEKVKCNEWLFTISTISMEKLLIYLHDNLVMSRPFWVPMNQLPMYKNCTYISKHNRSSKIHKLLLSIPCSTNISDKELSTVINKIKSFYN
tara:strand:+ start:1783 stop:2919 length:1137 start_codon:yes stop_codon:yes gene_type:complete